MSTQKHGINVQYLYDKINEVTQSLHGHVYLQAKVLPTAETSPNRSCCKRKLGIIFHQVHN